jgi:prepilin-type N-terminal cleavage/methylation domain-containing protein/prepilin-type processing-associated H-X9-DG protein
MRTTLRKAFTLVELLVVIGIIAVLIAIILPALNNARAAANSTACLANLRQMGQAVQMYAMSNKGLLPYGYWNGSRPIGPNANYPISTDWTILLLNTLASKQHGVNYTDETGKWGGVKELFRDKDTVEGTAVTHYSAHPRLMPDLSDVDVAAAIATLQTVYLTPYKVARIRKPAQIVLIMDGTQIRMLKGSQDQLLWGAEATVKNLDNNARQSGPGSGGRSYLLTDYPGATDDASIDPGPNTDPNTDNNGNIIGPASQEGNIRWRHMKGKSANFLFVDGHAEPRALKKATVGATIGSCDLRRANINVNKQ